MMIFKKNKIVQALVLSSSLYATHSVAGIPTFDAALNAIMANQYVQDGLQWVEQKSMMLANMNQDTLLNMLKMQNDNALAAANLSRESQLTVDIENMRKVEDQMPIDVCKEASAQADIIENECSLQDTTRKAVQTTVGKFVDEASTTFDLLGQGMDPDIVDKALSNNRIKEQGEALEKCSTPIIDTDINTTSIIKDENGVSIEVQGEVIEMPCARADYIMGSDTNKLTKFQADAAEQSIQLLTGAMTSAKKPPTNMINPAARLNYLRDIGYRSIVSNSLNKQLELRRPMDGDKGPSKLSAIGDVIESEFGSVEAIQDMDQLNANTTAANIKYIAKLQRTMLYIQYLQFEQNLRMEGIQAALLSLEMENEE